MNAPTAVLFVEGKDVPETMQFIEKNSDASWDNGFKPTTLTDTNHSFYLYITKNEGKHTLSWSSEKRLYGGQTYEAKTVASFLINAGTLQNTPKEIQQSNNHWNTTCPYCGNEAYQGIGAIECSKNCIGE
jgi:hypothetical protein